MLILAGVSLNAIVGDNGVVTQAMKAKEMAEEAARREELEYVLFNFNASEYADQSNGLDDYLINSKRNGDIDNFITSTDGEIVVIEKDGQYYQLEKNSNDGTYEVSNTLGDNIKTILEEEAKLQAEGEKTSSIILTQKTLNETEGFTFKNGQTYIIVDENLKGDDFDFRIPAGDPVTIKIAYDMTIDNSESPNRSAIDLEDGATLNLYVFGNVKVDSSLGIAGEESSSGSINRAIGGAGAKAGIHVTKNSTLNIYGSGTLKCYGGRAGDGGGTNNGNLGGAGGGGAGAGIGGNGGTGGDGNSSNNSAEANALNSDKLFNSIGNFGFEGEDCGNINIHNSVKVNAYGGGGGAGGFSTASSGGGAGGYPGAGIGGGGAGGGSDNGVSGGGGFTGGNQEPDGLSNQIKYLASQRVHNGLAGAPTVAGYTITRGPGSGYFQKAIDDYTMADYSSKAGSLGGGGCTYISSNMRYLESGDGGAAGKGGNVKVSKNAKIYAYNGNKFTDNSSFQQCPIYAQNGILLEIEMSLGTWTNAKNEYYSKIFGRTINYSPTYGWDENVDLEFVILRQYTEDNSIKLSYKNTEDNNSNYGIGSGAGFIEISNGTYNEYNENENGLFINENGLVIE